MLPRSIIYPAKVRAIAGLVDPNVPVTGAYLYRRPIALSRHSVPSIHMSIMSCPAGFICDEIGAGRTYSCEQLKVDVEQKGFGSILDGIYCPEGTSKIRNCPAGFYCESTTDDAKLCPEGLFCPMKVRHVHYDMIPTRSIDKPIVI